jgi:hypothetical protein
MVDDDEVAGGFEHRLVEAFEPFGGGGLEVVGWQDQHRGRRVVF